MKIEIGRLYIGKRSGNICVILDISLVDKKIMIKHAYVYNGGTTFFFSMVIDSYEDSFKRIWEEIK